jgi:AraC-like DNA-binding protein
MTGPSDQSLHGVVPSTYVSLLFDYLERQGHAASAVLGEGRPDAAVRYPVARWRMMLERASAHLGDPALGLHLGQTITPAHFGVMGYVLLACPNVGAALGRLMQYQRLLYDVNPMRYTLDDEVLTLKWGVEAGRPGALVDECAITALIQLLRDVTGRAAGLLEIDFVNPEPADPAPYRRYFHCLVRFAQPATVVRVRADALALPLRGPDPALLDVLERQADALLAALPPSDDFEQGVRRCIARLAREGEPSMERVANELHCSTRTLHRRLEERGSGFRALVDDTRRRLADDYLADPRLQLAEIALLLGYSEQSAFTRAYRRWTGRTPKMVRRAAG